MRSSLFFLLTMLVSFNSNATSVFCSPKENGRVDSDIMLEMQKEDSGYVFFLSIPSKYKSFEYSGAMVMSGAYDSPDLYFFPELEKSDDGYFYSSLFFSKQELQQPVLVAEYGNYCIGDGYEVVFSFNKLE